MLRVSAFVAAVLMFVGCSKGPQGPQLQPVVKETVSDGAADFDVEVGVRELPPEQVEIVVELAAIGIEQSEKVVVDVVTEGFVIMDGTKEWTGFVRPREHYEHRVAFKLLDDVQHARATVEVRRSINSELLWEAPIEFTRAENGVQLVSGDAI